jgi:hypothetical protein
VKLLRNVVGVLVAVAAFLGIVAFGEGVLHSVGVGVGIASGCVLMVVMWWVGGRLLDLARRAGQADQLEKDLGEAGRRIEELEQSRRGLPEAVRAAYDSGVQEGHKQIGGSFLAHMPRTAVPKLTSVTLDGGRLQLVGESEPAPQVGARYWLCVVGSLDIRGVLEVVSVKGAVVKLECVEKTVPAYWKRLREEAAERPDPPTAVQLYRYMWLRAGPGDQVIEQPTPEASER